LRRPWAEASKVHTQSDSRRSTVHGLIGKSVAQKKKETERKKVHLNSNPLDRRMSLILITKLDFYTLTL
jgi:hypothetical protein